MTSSRLIARSHRASRDALPSGRAMGRRKTPSLRGAVRRVERRPSLRGVKRRSNPSNAFGDTDPSFGPANRAPSPECAPGPASEHGLLRLRLAMTAAQHSTNFTAKLADIFLPGTGRGLMMRGLRDRRTTGSGSKETISAVYPGTPGGRIGKQACDSEANRSTGVARAAQPSRRGDEIFFSEYRSEPIDKSRFGRENPRESKLFQPLI